MVKMLLLYFLLLFIIQCVNSKSTGYHIPEPDILAFKNGGIRIILEDSPGITLFGFHANINEDMKQLNPGTINIETFTKTNKKWIVEDRSVKLHAGDIVFYWLSVEKDKLAYVKQPLEFKIKQLVPYYHDDVHEEVSFPPFPVLITTTTTTESSPTPCPPNHPITLTNFQEQINALNRKLDLLTSITALQGQVDTLSKKFDGVSSSSVLQNEVKNISNTVNLILTVLERLPEAKRLTLGGAVPPNQMSSPDQIVRYVLKEKLGLQVDVVTAVRSKDGTINFELSTLEEKFFVLNAVKEKLKDSKLVIE